MTAPRLGLLLLGTIALASCGQQLSAPTAATPAQSSPVAAAPDTDSVAAQIAGYATRPELQDADSQAILKDHASDPLMLSALQEAYGQAAAPLDAAALAAQTSGQMPLSAQATGKAGYAQSVAWGSVSNYRYQKAHPRYSGLNWGSDGCSAPSGLGLGYRDTFRPACDVHDFGYGNLPKLTGKLYWPYNKARTDSAFLSNMRAICGAKSIFTRPACYVAAQAYYKAVDIGGWPAWIRNG